MTELRAPLQAQVVEWLAAPGDVVRAGDLVVVLEAMKMEHEVRAPAAGTLAERLYAVGETVDAGALLARIVAGADPTPPVPRSASQDQAAAPSGPAPSTLANETAPAHARDRAAPRPDLGRVFARQALTEDAARPDAVAKRHALGLRTARENIADLCDPGSFTEYGALAVAAQRSRRSDDDLARNTPAAGMVSGIGSINGDRFAADKARAVVMAYDATVLAGTQGWRNHQKTDRLLAVALKNRLPVVLFAEGGGGRPGDTDMPIVAGLHVPTFASFARLNGQVPVIGVVAGRCFAGNAALLGCCDVVIATRGSNIGMGGPAAMPITGT
ncbi:MAG: biotin carboxylase, partial [Comamonadaceae bacterium]